LIISSDFGGQQSSEGSDLQLRMYSYVTSVLVH